MATSAGRVRRASCRALAAFPGTWERIALINVGQSDNVGAELLQRGVANAALLRAPGVLAALVCAHQHLSLEAGTAHGGLLHPTVSDGDGRQQRRVKRVKCDVRGLGD